MNNWEYLNQQPPFHMSNDHELKVTTKPGTSGSTPLDEELVDKSAVPPGEEEEEGGEE